MQIRHILLGLCITSTSLMQSMHYKATNQSCIPISMKYWTCGKSFAGFIKRKTFDFTDKSCIPIWVGIGSLSVLLTSDSDSFEGCVGGGLNLCVEVVCTGILWKRFQAEKFIEREKLRKAHLGDQV